MTKKTPAGYPAPQDLKSGRVRKSSIRCVDLSSSCSSSVMRVWSSSRCSSGWNKVCARSKNVLFQRLSRFGLSACLRHVSAGDCAPVSTSRTIWNLNSGVNRRRFLVPERLPRGFKPHYAMV